MRRERLLLRGFLWFAVLGFSLLALWAYVGHGVVEFGAASNDVLMLKENADWQVSTRPKWVDTVRATSVVGLSLAAVLLAVASHQARTVERDRCA